MAVTYKVLGQSSPSATTNTDLYTCASSGGAVASTLSICNRSATSIAVRVAIRPAGATLANQHYIVYDTPVAANNTLFLTIGISLANTDVVTVYTGTAGISFNLFGSEVS
jgi:hypothetical protein